MFRRDYIKALGVLYEKAGQLERGIRFLDAQRKSKRDRCPQDLLEDTLFDLALKGGRLDVAQSVVDSMTSRDEGILCKAQLHAARGEVEESLGLVRKYLADECEESGCRILVRPGFVRLHGNPQFQAMMVEAQENEERRMMDMVRRRAAEEEGVDPRKGSKTAVDLKGLIDVLRQGKDAETARSRGAEVEKALRKVAPLAAGRKDELLSLLRGEKESPYCRLALALLLASIHEGGTTKAVVE